jgi:hypothetical protein
MLSYEAWTDGRTAVCHNKPVFLRAYKNEWPISLNYEYIIFGQIIFQNFYQFKAFVGLSDYSYGPIKDIPSCFPLYLLNPRYLLGFLDGSHTGEEYSTTG